MQQENDRDSGHHQTFLQQGALQRLNRGIDQGRAVVDRHDLGAFGQGLLHIGQSGLGIFDHRQCVRADPLQDDAADHLAVAVQFGDAAPFIRYDFHLCHVQQPQRHTGFGHQGDVFNIGHVFQIAAPAHHEFKFRNFNGAPAGIHVAVAHRLANIGQRHALCPHPGRIDDDGILLDEPANTGNLGHAIGL